MAGYGSSANISGSSNSSYSGAQQTPQSEFSLQIANAAAAVGQYVVKWAQQVYAQTSAITDQTVTNFLQASQYGMQLAETQLNQYTNTYVPEMNQLAGEAATYSSPSRVAYNMGAAGANAASGAYAANQGTLQNLRSYGVDPSSGMYGDILAAQNTAAGASEAGAENQAQVNTEATGRQLLQNSITAGEQLPGDVVNALNSAYQGVSGAENSVLSNANTGAAVQAVAAPYYNAAGAALHPLSTASVSRATQGSIGSGGSGSGSKSTPMGQMGRALGNQGTGGGAPAASSPPGIQTTSNPFYTGPTTGVNLSDVNPSAPGFNEFGGDNPEAALGNDPFNQQFTQYQGDTSNPFTNTDGGSSYGMPGAGVDGAGDVPQYNADPGAGWGDFSSPAPTDWSSGATNSGFDGSFGGDGSSGSSDPAFGGSGSSGSGSSGFGNYSTPSQPNNMNGGYGSVNNYGGAGSDYSGGGGGGGGGGYYAQGGRVQHNFRPPMHRGVLPTNATTGGQVPRHASPSGGRQTDDVAARLNAGEFVIPRDVAAWKGQEFFQNLINQSRKKRVGGGAPAQGKMKPALNQRPSFVSQQMGGS